MRKRAEMYYKAIRAMPEEFVHDDTVVTEWMGTIVAANPELEPIVYTDGVWVKVQPLGHEIGEIVRRIFIMGIEEHCENCSGECYITKCDICAIETDDLDLCPCCKELVCDDCLEFCISCGESRCLDCLIDGACEICRGEE